MRRALAIILVMVFVAMGCATAKIQALRPGMTKVEVEDLLGKPQGYQSIGPTEVYTFKGLLMSDGATDYDMYFLDGKLKEWVPTYTHRPATGVFFIPPTPRY